MRVVTPFGFGEVDELLRTGSVVVNLDQPFLGDKSLELDSGSQVFPFTDVAVARVLSVSGVGLVSNLQFYRAPTSPLLSLPTPPDETTFFLSLATGDFLVNRELGVLAQEALWINPWVDRWARERSMPFEDVASALAAFESEMKRVAGSAGIQASVLLNVRARKILRLCLIIAPPQGVIFEKAW